MSFAARASERAALLGLPCYPPYELQQALDRTSKLWLCQARALARADPVALRDVHLFGTNHLMPWFASRVADAVQRQAASGHPYASIAIELPPGQHSAMHRCSVMMTPVLAELAHTRFARMPDLRALQRLLGTDTRERLSVELEALGLDPTSLALLGFVEGMELLQALRLGQLHQIPVVCVDTSAVASTTAGSCQPSANGALASSVDNSWEQSRSAQSGRSEGGAQEGGQAARSTGTGSLSQGVGQGEVNIATHPGAVSGSQQGLVEHVMTMRLKALAWEASVQQRSDRAHPLHATQAGWHERAAGMLESGVDRNLLWRDEFMCLSQFTSAWADPAALVRPRALREVLNAALGWSSQGVQRHRVGHASDDAVGVGDMPHAWTAAAQHAAPDMGYTTQQAEREVHMAQAIQTLPRPVLCVIGAAHVWGVRRGLQALVR